MASGELSDAADSELTRRQLEILQFIEDFARRNGYGPTHREIGEAVGLASPSSVAYQLRELNWCAKGA
jgi:repressor LexA